MNTRPMLGVPQAYRPDGVAPPPPLSPRSQTVVPGRGGPDVTIMTPGGWAPAIPPYITYPVQNLAWGTYDSPPYANAKFIPQDQAMLSPGAPPRTPAAPAPVPAPAPARAPARAPAPAPASPSAPLPVQDWFNLLRR